ncbi:hypothetical protein [Chitinophaga sp. YIM B06452]|uniref:hypothetical protein n=1 Tax=Chitinophaga sp. YIM B06452 TaxID=3082158 RepID=UPI0031FE8774
MIKKIVWANYTPDDFQLFCNSLLTFEVGKQFIPYGAKGKDKGFDGSFQGVYDLEEGNWRFQYKYHSTPTAKAFSSLKTDIKNEAKKIKDENHFVLLTNVELSKSQQDQLLEIGNKHKPGGATTQIILWDGAKLHSLYLKYPILHTWLEERFHQLKPFEYSFSDLLNAGLQNMQTLSNEFAGRTKELNEVHQALVNPDILLINISGEAGLGKTRLAVEYIQNNIQTIDSWHCIVLESGNISGTDIAKALSGTTNYLVFIDDAHNHSPQLILDIFKVAESSHNKIKILLTSRSLIGYYPTQLINSKSLFKVKTVELTKFTPEETSDYLEIHLKGTYLEDHVSSLVQISRGIPILIVALLRAAHEHISIPEIKNGNFLIQYVLSYFESCINYINSETNISKLNIRRIIKLVCLLEPFDYHDQNILKEISSNENVTEHETRFILNTLVNQKFSFGQKKKEIKPDYYSDIYLNNELTTPWVESVLANYVDFTDNIIRNLGSIASVHDGQIKENLLEKMLVEYLGRVEYTQDTNELEKIFDTLEHVAHIYPSIALNAIGKTLTFHPNVVVKDSSIYRSILFLLSNIANTSDHLSVILQYTNDIYNLSFDQNIFQDIFGYASLEVYYGINLERQMFFVQKSEELLREQSTLSDFIIHGLNKLLELDFTLTTISGNRLKYHIRTFYLPETADIIQLRNKIIDLLICGYSTEKYDAKQLAILDTILEIPGTILRSKSRKNPYKGELEIQKVFLWLENVLNSTNLECLSKIINSLRLYKLWFKDEPYITKLNEIESKLTPGTLTEKIMIQLSEDYSNISFDESDDKVRKFTGQLIADFKIEDLFNSAYDIFTRVPDNPRFPLFVSTIHQNHHIKSIEFFELAWLKGRKFFHHYGSYFLQSLCFRHDDRLTFSKFIQRLQDEDSQISRNLILDVYSYSIPWKDKINNDDHKLILSLYNSKKPVNQLVVSQVLGVLYYNNASQANTAIADFVTNCNQREADLLFRTLYSYFGNYNEEYTKILLGNVRFHLSYELERCLNEVIKSHGFDSVWQYLLRRYDKKLELINTNGHDYTYEYVPRENSGLIIKGMSETDISEIFVKAIEWFFSVSPSPGYRDQSIYLVKYFRPKDEITSEIFEYLDNKLNFNITNVEFLKRLSSILQIFKKKNEQIITLALRLYNVAYKINNASKVKDGILSDCYFALTSVGAKTGTPGQPFPIDLEMKKLFEESIEKFKDQFDNIQILHSALKSFNRDIESSLNEDGLNDWN